VITPDYQGVFAMGKRSWLSGGWNIGKYRKYPYRIWKIMGMGMITDHGNISKLAYPSKYQALPSLQVKGALPGPMVGGE